VEREFSDANDVSISRTLRYRHNAYDDMLATSDSKDPCNGNYTPSEKSPISETSKMPKTRKGNHSEEINAEGDHRSKSKKHKQKQKKDTSADNSAQNGHTKSGYFKNVDCGDSKFLKKKSTDQHQVDNISKEKQWYEPQSLSMETTKRHQNYPIVDDAINNADYDGTTLVTVGPTDQNQTDTIVEDVDDDENCQGILPRNKGFHSTSKSKKNARKNKKRISHDMNSCSVTDLTYGRRLSEESIDSLQFYCDVSPFSSSSTRCEPTDSDNSVNSEGHKVIYNVYKDITYDMGNKVENCDVVRRYLEVCRGLFCKL